MIMDQIIILLKMSRETKLRIRLRIIITIHSPSKHSVLGPSHSATIRLSSSVQLRKVKDIRIKLLLFPAQQCMR